MAEPTPEMMVEHIDGQVQTLLRENERLRAALKIADDDIRHHLRSDKISVALISKDAVKAIREALKD